MILEVVHEIMYSLSYFSVASDFALWVIQSLSLYIYQWFIINIRPQNWIQSCCYWYYIDGFYYGDYFYYSIYYSNLYYLAFSLLSTLIIIIGIRQVAVSNCWPMSIENRYRLYKTELGYWENYISWLHIL